MLIDNRDNEIHDSLKRAVNRRKHNIAILAVKSYGKRTITVSDLFQPIAQIGAVGTELPANAFNEHLQRISAMLGRG